MGIMDPGYFKTPVGKGVIVAMLFIATIWVTLEVVQHLHGPIKPTLHADNKTQTHTRTKRAEVNLLTVRSEQIAVTRQDLRLVFWYNSSATQVATYTFDFCQVVSCPLYGWYCQYYSEGQIYICLTDQYWGYVCKYWGSAAWNTGHDWGYKPDAAMNGIDKHGQPLRTRMTIKKTGQACVKGKAVGNPQQLTLNIENPSPGDAGLYIMSLYVKGTSGWPIGRFYLRDMFNNPEFETPKAEKQVANVKAIANPTFEDTIAVGTGYSDTNMWLEWMRYTAGQHNMSDCYVCAGARPHRGTVPLPLPEGGERCFLSLYSSPPKTPADTDPLCKMWIDKFPLTQNAQGSFEHPATVYKGNYTCYNSTREGGTDLKRFPPGYCGVVKPADPNLMYHHTHSIGDIFWLCGDLKLRSKLPPVWKGECALAKLIMPIHMFKETKEVHRLMKRELKGSIDPHVYIDAIGVPRGVPDEFKARNQVAAGFESIIPWITINKNVDWINYIYYNQQRFVNYTRDALQGIINELGPNSKMTFQNRMSLDMMLAEKGGVCKFLGLGGTCCTYIPSETGPDGKVTEALAKLTDLSEELERNSGVSDPFTKWFESWFGGWGNFLKQVGTVLLMVTLLFSLLACCVFPLGKKYLASFINAKTVSAMYTALDKEEGDIEVDEHDYPRIDFSHL